MKIKHLFAFENCSDYRNIRGGRREIKDIEPARPRTGFGMEVKEIDAVEPAGKQQTIRRYPAFIENKTFLPTYSLSSKSKDLDEEDYGELTLGDQLDGRDRMTSDPSDNERWHVCNKCNKVFGTSKELRRHLPRHKVSKKVFECEICFRTFTQSNHLKQHMPVHSGKSLLAI